MRSFCATRYNLSRCTVNIIINLFSCFVWQRYEETPMALSPFFSYSHPFEIEFTFKWHGFYFVCKESGRCMKQPHRSFQAVAKVRNVTMYLVSSIKTHKRSRGIAPLILNLTTRGRWVVNFTPRVTLHPGKNPGTHRKWGWVGHTAGLDVWEKKKFSCAFPGSKTVAFQAVA